MSFMASMRRKKRVISYGQFCWIPRLFCALPLLQDGRQEFLLQCLAWVGNSSVIPRIIAGVAHLPPELKSGEE
jgi:hypothetical protein